MVFTKRERNIAIGLLIGAGILLIDQLGIGPLLNYRSKLRVDRNAVEKQLLTTKTLIERKAKYEQDWKRMQTNGLKANASDAESLVLDNLARWGNEAGVTLTSSRQDRPIQEKNKNFQEIVVRASANGSMSSIAQMLMRIETTPLPARINAISITPRKEATDDLTVQITLSALCLSPDTTLADRTPHGGN